MTVVVEHSINAIMQQLKSLVSKLSPEDQKILTKAIGLQEQNEARLEQTVLTATTSWPVYEVDPANANDGSVWVNKTDGKARIQINGSTVDLN